MKLKILGETSLLQYAALSRDAAGIPRLHLETEERGATISEGFGQDEGAYPGPFLLISPPEDSPASMKGCEVWVEPETLEEYAELGELIMYSSRSKENYYVAFLPVLGAETGVPKVWEGPR